MTTYIFHRDSGFYPIELRDDDDAREHAKLNPGTLKVENAATGEIIWRSLMTPHPGAERTGTPEITAIQERVMLRYRHAKGIPHEQNAFIAVDEMADVARELQRERDAARAEVVRLAKELAVNAALRGSGGGWIWQGDGSDKLESLTCPVVVTADDMRKLTVQLEALRADGARLDWLERKTYEKADALCIYEETDERRPGIGIAQGLEGCTESNLRAAIDAARATQATKPAGEEGGA